MNGKIFRVVVTEKDFSVEDIALLSQEDLTFMLWCFDHLYGRLGQDEYMNGLERRYFMQQRDILYPKLKAVAEQLKEKPE